MATAVSGVWYSMTREPDRCTRDQPCARYTLEIMKGLTGQGQCTWGDVDGDKIFSDWKGGMPPKSQFEAKLKITGGTGKYAGIQGKASEHCKPLNANGQWACTEQFDYRLP